MKYQQQQKKSHTTKTMKKSLEKILVLLGSIFVLVQGYLHQNLE